MRPAICRRRVSNVIRKSASALTYGAVMSKPTIFTCGTRKPLSGADIATTFRPPPPRPCSTNCWRKSRRWRSIFCLTITRASIRPRSCKSPRCVKPSRPRPEWRRSSTGAYASCCAPRAASWCAKAKAVTRSGRARSPSEISPCPSASQVAIPRMPSCSGRPAQIILTRRRARKRAPAGRAGALGPRDLAGLRQS